MNIMTALFDQDYVTRMYGVDQRREGMKEGKIEGIKEGKIEGMKEGKIEGMKEGINKTALKLIKMGMSDDVIAEATGLSVKEIEKLRKEWAIIMDIMTALFDQDYVTRMYVQ